MAALRARPGRTAIITDDLNFPSDLYILQGIVDLLGGQHRIDVVPSPDGIHGPEEAIKARLDSDVALLTLSHVVFKSGYLYDMAGLTAAAHAAGALTLWDLSHAAGAVPVDLNGSRRGSGHRLHLQVSQRRTWLAGLPLRAARPAGAAWQPADRLAGPAAALRLRPRLQAGERACGAS